MSEIVDLKQALGVIAIALTFAAFAPYVVTILRGQTKPHVFSWVIWGATTFVVAFAQLADGAGAGAWPIMVSGIISAAMAVLSFVKRGDYSVTRSDWLFLALGLSSLPAWYFTADPLAAVIILTIADLAGFGPTIRKGYARPFEENLAFYVIITLRNAVAIAALEAYSLTTVLWPLLTGLAGPPFIVMVLMRRRALSVDTG